MSILNFIKQNFPNREPDNSQGSAEDYWRKYINSRKSSGSPGVPNWLKVGIKLSVPGLLANSFSPEPQLERVPGTPVADPSYAQYGPVGSGIASTMNQPPSMEDILAELQGLQDPSRYAADPALLQRQALATAAAQYDPVINQLRNQEGLARTRAERNRTQLGSMFSGLSQSLMQDIAPIQQQYANTKQQTNQQYQDLSNSINQQYANS